MSNDTREQSLTARIQEVRAVLFDLDGTLIDTVVLIRDSMRHATREVLGESLADELLMHNVGIPLRAQMEVFSAENADRLVTSYREYNAIVHDDLIADYPGVEAVLQGLKDRRVPMGVVTSKSRAVALRGLELFGLTEYFETIVCSDDVTRHKPDPHPLLKAAEEMSVRVERCVYVGDSPHDMSAALSAGMVAVAALWGAFPPEDVLRPGADFALRDIQELEGLLDGEAASYLVEHKEAKA